MKKNKDRKFGVIIQPFPIWKWEDYLIFQKRFYYDCKKLKEINLSSFDTKNVVNMSGMFCGSQNLTNLNLSSFDTKNITNMYFIFGNCKNLTNLNLSSFNTKNVTNIS